MPTVVELRHNGHKFQAEVLRFEKGNLAQKPVVNLDAYGFYNHEIMDESDGFGRIVWQVVSKGEGERIRIREEARQARLLDELEQRAYESARLQERQAHYDQEALF